MGTRVGLRWRSVLAAVACSVLAASCGGGESASPTTTVAQAPPDEAPPSTQVVPASLDDDSPALVDEDGVAIEIDPRPGDLSEAIDVAVGSSVIEEPTAVLGAIEGVLGLGPAPAGLGTVDAQRAGLTGLIQRMVELQAAGRLSDEESQRADLILRLVSPSPAALASWSRPASDEGRAAGDGVTAVLAVSPAGGPQPETARVASRPTFQVLPDLADVCTQLLELGFGEDGDNRCFNSITRLVEGTTIHFYYPAFWLGDETRMGRVKLAADEVVETQSEYARLPGIKVGDVNVVFTPLVPDDDKIYAVASFGFDHASEPCPVAVYEHAIDQLAEWKYLNTINHELFHCAQYRTFDVSPASQNKWWVESSADYFGNWAHPPEDWRSIYDNDKDPWFSLFKTRSNERPLTAMSYENWVFWQFYANERGNAKLIELLNLIDGRSDPLPILAGVDGMANLWHDFVKAFVAGRIMDPEGNGPIEIGNVFLLQDEIALSTRRTVYTGTFIATRYRIPFTAGRAYDQKLTGEARTSAVDATGRRNLGNWSEKPGAIEACGEERAWLYAPTTIRPEIEGKSIEIRAASCTCPVDAAEVSTAMGRDFSIPATPEGAPEGMNPANLQTFGVLGGCVFDSESSQMILLLVGTDVEEFRATIDAASQVDGFDDAAVYYRRAGQSEFSIRDDEGNLQYGGNDQVLEVVIGPIVHRISVSGNIVHDEGPDGVLSRLRDLVAVITANQAKLPPPSPPDGGTDVPSEPGAPTGSGDGEGPVTSGAGATPGGSTSGGGGVTGGPIATFAVGGEEYVYTQSITCTVSASTISVQIAGDGLFKADGEAGLITVQTQSTLVGTSGFRASLSLSDPALDIDEGGRSFTLTAPATRHDDVRDLGDPGSPAGDAVISVSC